MAAGKLDADRIRNQLRTRRIGTRIEVVDELDSTNRYVLKHDAGNTVDGVVVLAERQTAGRGRRGRVWSCPTGAGLLCTVGLECNDDALNPNLLALVVPLAICEALDATTDVRTEIKWPNDVLVNRRKLAGVLIEAHHCAGQPARYALGFGVNCLQQPGHFSSDLRNQATSLDMESSKPIHREDVLVAILNALDRYIVPEGRPSPEDICKAWRARAIGIGERVRLEYAGRAYTGNLVDIDPTAAIVVQLDEGGRRLFDAANTMNFELAP